MFGSWDHVGITSWLLCHSNVVWWCLILCGVASRVGPKVWNFHQLSLTQSLTFTELCENSDGGGVCCARCGHYCRRIVRTPKRSQFLFHSSQLESAHNCCVVCVRQHRCCASALTYSSARFESRLVFGVSRIGAIIYSSSVFSEFSWFEVLFKVKIEVQVFPKISTRNTVRILNF